jgi:hypothetical protein
MISDWATQFKLSVIRCEDRPDQPAGELVYRVKDIFTTRDGSWEPSDKPGSVTAWAREQYLRPWHAPDYFDDAGGDHHLFARVLDRNGQPLKQEGLVRCWSDGFQKLGDINYTGYISLTPKEKSGWANLVLFTSYNPDRDERGPWCWCPAGAADVVVGGGMPYNWHVSFFVVWQLEQRQTEGNPDTGGGTDPINMADVRRQAWAALPLVGNVDSAFAAYARTNNLGAPLTQEFDLSGYRVQGFANGIVFAPIDQWQQIQHTGW